MECAVICIMCSYMYKKQLQTIPGNSFLNDVISVKQFLDSNVNYTQTQI
jgi:uncharacterized Fe-S cluster-containing MiaB family protein